MQLRTGDKLGPYEIVSLLGRGGMGEVWRARDARLGREVAIKTSNDQFSDRFEKEARAIAALNHPNICTLYDVGPNYLVMELIEGPTLADRIGEGAIPLEEALGMARQISAALETAHENGIVHRDLKPGNVKLRPDGSVKVLDFGLAKSVLSAGQVTNDSPTLMAMPTQMGVILGTAAYMPPEQARGKEVDKRADIWSFGVVLHEMLTGKRLFQGEDLTETLASVVMKEPDISAAPAQVRRLLTKCLQKDPRSRLRDIGDVWELLEETAPLPSRLRNESGKGAWIAAALATLVAGTLAFLHFRETPPAAPVVTRFEFNLPEGQNFTRPGRHVLAISPDGKKLVYVANQQLYLRQLDQLEATPIRGTQEDPREPLFSPDGQWIAYFLTIPGGPGQIRKIAVSGGTPVTLGSFAGGELGAQWSGGNIVFGHASESEIGVRMVPDSGGEVRTVWRADRKQGLVAQPRLLADGKHVLLVASPGVMRGEGEIVVQGIDGSDRRTLVAAGADPQVLPSGHLAYYSEGTLYAVPFDQRHFAVTGGPVPLIAGVSASPGSFGAQFTVSRNGTLVFRAGQAARTSRSLFWVDREGREQPIAAEPRAYREPRLSPDGTRIAVAAEDGQYDIWIYDLTRATLTRATFEPAFEYTPIWAADGRRLYFASAPASAVFGASFAFDIYSKSADGTGEMQPLTGGLRGGYPMSLGPAGKLLSYAKGALYQIPLEQKGPAQLLLGSKTIVEPSAEVSPDGRWVAYTSTESGRAEIYVRPLPDVNGGRWQVTPAGGTRPAWSRSGRELYFLDSSNQMSVVGIQPGAEFRFGQPKALFNAGQYYVGSVSRNYDVAADGQRFLMMRDGTAGRREARSITVVSNWLEEVKAKAPGGK